MPIGSPQPSLRILALLALFCATRGSVCLAQTNPSSEQQPMKQIKPETSHVEFVTEYIRELAAVERIRAEGEEENKQDTKAGKLPLAGVHR